MFTATLRNWTIAIGGNKSLHPGQRVLFGSAYDHTHWDVKDGDPIRTNAILRFEGNVAVTSSGSRYELVGPACRDFDTWLAAQSFSFRYVVGGRYIPVAYPPAVTEVD